MANKEKTLNTRIITKHADLATWQNATLGENKGANFKLKEGEIVLARVDLVDDTATSGENNNISTTPAYLVKIGVEGKTFTETAWAYAKAVDVYAWAKAANKPAYSASEITGIEDFIAEYVNEEMGISVDTNTVYKLTATNTGYKLQSKGAGDADTAWVDVVDSVVELKDYAKSAEISAVYATIASLNTLSERVQAIEGQITSLTGAMHFIGTVTEQPNTANVTINNATVTAISGDVVIYKTTAMEYGIEYVFDGTNWQELGSEGSHLTKTEAANTYATKTALDTLAGENNTATVKGNADAITVLQGSDTAKSVRTIAAEEVDKLNITTAKIVDQAVTKDKLEQDVQDSLALADSAVQNIVVDEESWAAVNDDTTSRSKQYIAVTSEDIAGEEAHVIRLTEAAGNALYLGGKAIVGIEADSNSADYITVSSRQGLGGSTATEDPGHAVGLTESARNAIDSAKTALQQVVANDTEEVSSGIKVTTKANNEQKISIDDSLTWIFDCGGAE